MTHKVELIGKTVPVHPDYGSNATEFIAYVARVSNPGNQWNHETADKLLAYLEREKHWSPFEMFNIVIEVQCTRDIARQMLRHAIRPQEFSQRYAVVDMFSEPKEARFQDMKNRQNSIETDDEVLQEMWSIKQRNVIAVAHEAYDWALGHGVAKECARVVLPEGLTMTTLYFNGNVREWIHYLAARLHPTTQKEHRLIAQDIEKVINKVLHE